MECSLAKPQADQKSSGASNSFNSAVLPVYPSPLGYGMVGGGYGAVGAGYGAAGFASVTCSLPSSFSLFCIQYSQKNEGCGLGQEDASNQYIGYNDVSPSEET